MQIHAANGYLIDQFLRDGTNARTDDYGGPVRNRIRLLREVAEAVAAVVGADRTGVRMSPNEPIQGVQDSDPVLLFTAAAAALREVGIAFIELREPGADGTFGRAARPPVAPAIKQAFGGPVVLNSDYDGVRGQAVLDRGEADAIAFGRTFLANPDLPERIRQRAPLNRDVQATWYSQGPEGYTDYPTLDAA